MGKIGQPAIRLVSSLAGASDSGDILIWCPFLAGLEPTLGMWLGPLSWHDCNGALFSALETGPVPARATVFAGVFCTDPFRLDGDILAALHAAGVAGIANLPSVSFLDGAFGQTLAAMNLGVEREWNFLRRARSSGLRVAGCAGALAEAEALCAAGAELIIMHSGPEVPAAKDVRQRRGRLAGQLEDCGAKLVELSELLSAASSEHAAEIKAPCRLSSGRPASV